MTSIGAEIRKISTLLPIRLALLAVLVATAFLAWMNAHIFLQEAAQGDVEGISLTGVNSALVCLAACAYIGVTVVSQEYQSLPQEVNGGSQSFSTLLSQPRRSVRNLIKLVLAGGVSGIVAVCALAESEAISRFILGDLMPGVRQTDWSIHGRVVLYSILIAMLGSGVTLLLRNGLIPVIYLVASSTVISVGYLLAQRWSWAWYLPDAAGPALIRPSGPEAGMPSPLAAAVALVTWVVVTTVVALFVDSRRDPL